MSGTTVTMLGPCGGGPPQGDRFERLHALANATPQVPLPRVEETSWQHSAQVADTEGNLQGAAYASVSGYRQVVSGLDTYVSQTQLAAVAGAEFAGAASGQARIGQSTTVAGVAMADGQALAQAFADGTVIKSPTLDMAQGRALAEAAARIRGAAAGSVQVDDVRLSGAVAGEVEGVARASADGLLLSAPGVLQAQGQLLAEAAMRASATAMGQVQAGDVSVQGRAFAEAEAVARVQAVGGITASTHEIDARGQVVAESVVRAQVGGDVHAEAKSGLVADAGVAAQTMVGAQAKAGGLFHLGIDRDGQPSFGLGASAEATSGAAVKTQAHGYTSILGLIRIGASGSAEALAGVAGGLSGQVSYEDGVVTVGTGGRAAAGIGGGAEATVSVGLGKLPMGIVKTVAGPVVAIPGLLITSLVRGIHALTSNGPDPTAGSPGIEDLPEVVVNNVKHGVTMIGEGAQEVADQVVDVGKAIGSGAVAAGKAVADGAVFIGTNVGKGAAAVGEGVADGAVWVGTTVAKGASAVWHGITSLF